MTTISEALLTALKRAGAQEVFGIPGDFALSFFKVIEQSGILPLYTLSHEPGLGFAADAAARMRGAPAVAAVTYGAGALNMVNPVAGAYSEKSPLVVISGAPGSAEGSRGLLLHHQAKELDSQLRVYREITQDQAVLDDPRTAPQQIARVLRACREFSRPVYIEIPRDMVSAACQDVPDLPPLPYDDEAVAACADEVLARLAAARRPMLMVGVEARRYRLEDRIIALAHRLGLPVITSFMGRGLLAKPDAPLIGTYMGLAGDPALSARVEDADVLVMLGVILSDTNFGVSERRIDRRHSVLAADRMVRAGYHVYPDLPLHALLDALLERVPDRLTPPPAGTRVYPRGLVADQQPVQPIDIARAINDLFDAAGPMPMACDMGDCLFTAMDIVPTPMVASGYYATMGFGVPAGLGVQVAGGERCLVLVGDGAFQMTGWELGNCGRYGWNPIVVVFNNASWEMLRVFQPETRYNDLSEWPFARLAEALGGVGHSVATRAQLKDALARAHADRGRFQLVEVMLPRGAVSDTLARFVNAIKRGQRPAPANPA